MAKESLSLPAPSVRPARYAEESKQADGPDDGNEKGQPVQNEARKLCGESMHGQVPRSKWGSLGKTRGLAGRLHFLGGASPEPLGGARKNKVQPRTSRRASYCPDANGHRSGPLRRASRGGGGRVRIRGDRQALGGAASQPGLSLLPRSRAGRGHGAGCVPQDLPRAAELSRRVDLLDLDDLGGHQRLSLARTAHRARDHRAGSRGRGSRLARSAADAAKHPRRGRSAHRADAAREVPRSCGAVLFSRDECRPGIGEPRRCAGHAQGAAASRPGAARAAFARPVGPAPRTEGGLTMDELDRILSEEHVISPPPGFSRRVMAAVLEEASTPAPIPFPWRYAFAALAAMAVAGVVCTFFSPFC